MKYWILGLTLLAVDIGTKIIASIYLKDSLELVEIIPNFFTLLLTYNTGVAFSFPLPRFIQIFLTLSFLGYFFIWAFHNFSKLSFGEKTGSIFLIAGTLGNFIERVFYGRVTDFISLHWYHDFYFPVFNGADIFIFLGVCFWIAGMWKSNRNNDEIS